MKKLLLSSLVFAFAVYANDTAPQVTVNTREASEITNDKEAITNADTQKASEVDPTEKYRNKKSGAAIIHDSFYEAERYTGEIPAAWKEALAAFGYKEHEIEFYTAVRTNSFVEHVENKLVILRPNFFEYCTPVEQKVHIGLELALLRLGVESDYGGSHETFCNTTKDEVSFRKATIGLAALGLLALYRKQIVEKARQFGPAVKNVLFSQAAALIGGCWLLNKAHELKKEHDKISKFNQAQLMVVDKLGAEGLLSMREKQVNWSNNMSWWWKRKWYYLLGKLELSNNPESNLELIKEYVAKKETAAK